MLKKMRWRFILSAMAAILAVVLALVVGLNLFNYHLTAQRLDDILQRLMDVQDTLSHTTSEQEHEPILQGLMDRELEKRNGLPEAEEEPWPAEEQFDGEDFGEAPPEDEAPANRAGRGGRWQDGEFSTMPGPFGGHSSEFRYTLRYFVVHCDTSGAAIATDREFIASVSTEEGAVWAEAVVKSGKTSGYLNGYRYWNQTTMDGSTVLFLNAEREIQSARTTLLLSMVVALVSLLAVFVLVVLFSKRAIAPYVRNIETQKRFITDAGHELKTPLTAISASADVLEMDLPDNEWVASIQSECARMTKLVGDLVTLSRLDEETPFPEQSEFSLSEAVWEVSEPVATLAKAKGKTYIPDIADDLTLCGDRAAIGQMVSILLDNALKYADEHGLVRLTVRKGKKRAEIVVFNTCDTEKIPDVSRLFDRFYRPDASRSSHTGGNGIGLSIAKATAERHGGSISAKAEQGGLTFTVKL